MANRLSNPFIQEIAPQLVKSVTYWLAEENREVAIPFEEQVLASLDILMMLANHYQIPIGISAETAQKWHQAFIALFKLAHPDISDMQNTIAVYEDCFLRLKETILKYPIEPFGDTLTEK